MSVVVDASAVLAVIFEEQGADVVLEQAQGSLLSAVSLDEVLHKTARRGIAGSEIVRRPVLTADRKWIELGGDSDVRVIR